MKTAKAMAGGVIVKTIAEKTGLKAKEVKGIFSELQTIAYAEVSKTEKFVIPQLVMLKLKHKAATKAALCFSFSITSCGITNFSVFDTSAYAIVWSSLKMPLTSFAFRPVFSA